VFKDECFSAKMMTILTSRYTFKSKYWF